MSGSRRERSAVGRFQPCGHLTCRRALQGRPDPQQGRPHSYTIRDPQRGCRFGQALPFLKPTDRYSRTAAVSAITVQRKTVSYPLLLQNATASRSSFMPNPRTLADGSTKNHRNCASLSDAPTIAMQPTMRSPRSAIQSRSRSVEERTSSARCPAMDNPAMDKLSAASV